MVLFFLDFFLLCFRHLPFCTFYFDLMLSKSAVCMLSYIIYKYINILFIFFNTFSNPPTKLKTFGRRCWENNFFLLGIFYIILTLYYYKPVFVLEMCLIFEGLGWRAEEEILLMTNHVGESWLFWFSVNVVHAFFFSSGAHSFLVCLGHAKSLPVESIYFM